MSYFSVRLLVLSRYGLRIENNLRPSTDPTCHYTTSFQRCHTLPLPKLVKKSKNIRNFSIKKTYSYLVVLIPCNAGNLRLASHLHSGRVDLVNWAVDHALVIVNFNLFRHSGHGEIISITVKIDRGYNWTLGEHVGRVLQSGFGLKIVIA